MPGLHSPLTPSLTLILTLTWKKPPAITASLVRVRVRVRVRGGVRVRCRVRGKG